MPAHEKLSPKQFLYHEAHLTDRESIKTEGLRAGKEWSFGTGEVVPAGVYMNPHSHSEYGSSMNDSSHYGYDKWRVDVTGMDVRQDPSQPGNPSRYVPESIPADRIKLVKKGHPNWERHI